MREYWADVGEGPELMDAHYEVGDVVVVGSDLSNLRVVDEVDTAPEAMGSPRECRVYHLQGDVWNVCYGDWDLTLVHDKNKTLEVTAA